ncbi:MAG: hypothetical protein ACREBC_00045 [Pyrinomonadaceae bacterium]
MNLQGSIVALLDQGVVSSVNFATGVIIGRVCTKEQFGLYTLGYTVLGFAMTSQACLISTPYTIYSPGLARRGTRPIYRKHPRTPIRVLCADYGRRDDCRNGDFPRCWAQRLVTGSLIVVIPFMLLWEYARRVCFAALRMKTALMVDARAAALQIYGLLLGFRKYPSVGYKHRPLPVVLSSLPPDPHRPGSGRYALGTVATQELTAAFCIGVCFSEGLKNCTRPNKRNWSADGVFVARDNCLRVGNIPFVRSSINRRWYSLLSFYSDEYDGNGFSCFYVSA